jgi:hypothetical protein
MSRRTSGSKENHSSREEAPSSFESRPYVQSDGKSPEALASEDLQRDDSIDWHVTDDWPEKVPITLDEIETIEAYLREAIDDLLI